MGGIGVNSSQTQALPFCFPITLSLPEPAGGSGEGQGSLSCHLNLCTQYPEVGVTLIRGPHWSRAASECSCERSKQRRYRWSGEGWWGQPEERDNAGSSSICYLMSYILGCPSCYLAVGREPAEAPLTFAVLSKSTLP